MEKAKNLLINDFANNIREILNVPSIVNIDALISQLNGEIVYIDSDNKPINQISKTDTHRFKITLSNSNSEFENRFAAAHSLGHLFLHMGYLINEDKWQIASDYQDSAYYRFGHHIEEFEANEFAAALLMPKKEFFKAAKENKNDNHYDIENIANSFEVPISAVLARGLRFGLFSCVDLK